MPDALYPVTTRQRAFLTSYGIPPEVVEARGVQLDGVHVLVSRTEYPWAAHAIVTARAGDMVRMTLPYPDDATRDEAIAARNGDWEETVGPETAAIWRNLVER